MSTKKSEYSIKELKQLTEDEKLFFDVIEKEKINEVDELLKKGNVRINCLDKNGMTPLSQACFKGNEHLVEMLLAAGADADNRAHDDGYTALMFAALAGKPRICQQLLDAGASPQAVNIIGKTAGELAAFVGQHECVSIISSHVSIEDIERILHPQGAASQPQYSQEFVLFIHQLTRTHAFHPVKLILDIAGNKTIWQLRKKAIWTVDFLFEKQLRSKEPNEYQSLKLWLILHTLRELLKRVEEQEDMGKDKHEGENELEFEPKLALNFALILLNDRPKHLVRHNEEQFIRQAIAAFPYKQSMLWQALSKQITQIPFGTPPPAFKVLCHSLLGPRFVQTAHFCRTCATPSAQKRCKNCKLYYCSIECQRFDWPIHKKCCEQLKKRREEEEKQQTDEGMNIVIEG